MDSDIKAFSEEITENTGIKFAVYDTSGVFLAGHAVPFDKFPTELDGVVSSVKNNATFFRLRFRSKNYTGVIAGSGKVEKNYGLHVLDNPTDEANQDYGTYFDFSGFDGLPYTQFRIRFFELAKSMASYGFKGILIPLDDWITKYGESVYTKVNNPIYNIVRLINADYKAMKRELKDTILIFSRNGGWFAIHVNSYDPKNYTVFLSNIETLCYGMTNTGGEKKAATGIVPPVPPTKVDQDDEENAELKDQLVDAIAQQAEDAESVEDFYDQSDDERIMQIIQDSISYYKGE